MKKTTPENLVKKEVRDWLSLHGWFFFPIYQTLGSYRGVPDIIAIKLGTVLFIECKAKTGKLSAYQKEFQRNIELSGGYYIVARGCEDIEKFLREQN